MANQRTQKSKGNNAIRRAKNGAPGKARTRARHAPEKRRGKPAQPAKKACWWALPVSCLMLLVLAAASFLIIREVGENERFRVMRQTVETQSYYTGIVVEGYSLSGVDYQTALAHWQNVIEPQYRDRAITLSYEGEAWSTTALELGYTCDYAQVLESAWTRGRSGTLEQRYRSINQIRTSVERYEVHRTLFDADRLRAWTDAIAAALTSSAVEARVTGFDVVSLSFTYSKSSKGYGVNADELYESAYAKLMSGGGTLAIDVTTIAPEVSEADLQGKYGLITSAVTNATSSTANRLTNLRLACAAINGYCVEPGATFSYNDVVGARTAKRGYKKATVYMSGEVAEDIGGGVCQVSTTLWNAAMKANCEIVERHEHSRPVAYVDKGKDATVSWTSQDMKFKNTSDSPMYLVCYVTDNKRVYCDIYGELFPDGKYITIEAKTTQTIKPGEATYTYNPLLSSGQTVVVSEARTGYKAVAYRVFWNADGTEIARSVLCESYYKPARASVEYG